MTGGLQRPGGCTSSERLLHATGLTSSTQALLGGTGTLYSWVPVLNKGHGGWHLVMSNVTYKATANAATKTATASFGTTINYTPSSGLPNSSPIALSRGVVFIA